MGGLELGVCLRGRFRSDLQSSRLVSTTHITSLTRTCPSCGALLPTRLPVCLSCNWIAGVHNSIPFHELMGLPYSPNPFVVDTALLKRRFLEAQRICHPDAWATKTEPEKEAALELSNTVNAAYKTLTSPLHRIEYILKRNGVELEEADQLNDFELINEIMEAREEIDNVQPGNADRLHELRDENNAKISQLVKMIERLVAKADWRETKNAAVRLKYLDGIEQAIRRRLEIM
ncbi:hypothetical protein BKA82DRAFT_937146 [Pisolithus tinctorius]|uniref:Co-chaperone HscB C-terminal oligomerisation domain-containing protein n=1 Tax=Pisolithus tinctorius Marx 270 TaxID=870435 RepID=A0A0C3PJE4_PISTI|nr:hypothetical protein BKA82DRAFT_937146 [Pisolithus tinctorius]KIO08279.1 hypothetical protein M404DRAFT_937146 [Pisolithus tinctorius Marx 270]